MENVGGFLGLSTDCVGETCSTLWQSGAYTKANFMTLVLGQEGAYDWWYKAESKEIPHQDPESLFSISVIKERSLMANRGKMIEVINIPTLHNQLQYKIQYFDFMNGVLNSEDQLVQHTMGIAGLGLPESLYMIVASKLYD